MPETRLKMPKPGAYIRSVGHYVPDRRLTKEDLKNMLDVDEEWIFSRTGIRERRILGPASGIRIWPSAPPGSASRGRESAPRNWMPLSSGLLFFDSAQLPDFFAYGTIGNCGRFFLHLLFGSENPGTGIGKTVDR
jgi:hypothetical protein